MTTQAGATKESRSRFRLIGETIGELRKVVWLSRREAAYLTVLVIVVAGAVGLILGVLDYGFTNLIDKVLIGG